MDKNCLFRLNLNYLEKRPEPCTIFWRHNGKEVYPSGDDAFKVPDNIAIRLFHHHYFRDIFYKAVIPNMMKYGSQEDVTNLNKVFERVLRTNIVSKKGIDNLLSEYRDIIEKINVSGNDTSDKSDQKLIKASHPKLKMYILMNTFKNTTSLLFQCDNDDLVSEIGHLMAVDSSFRSLIWGITTFISILAATREEDISIHRIRHQFDKINAGNSKVWKFPTDDDIRTWHDSIAQPEKKEEALLRANRVVQLS